MENIFKYFTEKFTESGNVDYTKMTRVLDKGVILTNGGKFDLPNGYLYTLASIETALKFLEALDGPDILFTQWPIDNGFSGATSSMSTGILNKWGSKSQTEFETKGVYEATNSTSDLSWFSTTYKFVLNYSDAKEAAQAAQAEKSISEGPIKEIRKSSSSIFLDRGIVIYYSSETDSILFSSVETFLKYSEAVGVFNSTLSVKYNYFENGTKFYDNYLNLPVYF